MPDVCAELSVSRRLLKRNGTTNVDVVSIHLDLPLSRSQAEYHRLCRRFMETRSGVDDHCEYALMLQ